MIRFENLSLRRGNRELLKELNLTINARDKIGMTGANGCGKSSLFALIRGQLHEDAGEIRIAPRMTIAHVAQETPAEAISSIDYVMRGDAELEKLQQALTEAEQQHLGDEVARLHQRMHEIDGYTAKARAARLMNGLGFSSEDESRSVASFSGGWRMRLNLAQALMCRSDLLLLDEPTNHLDLEAVIWLEEWLKQYQGALLLISHDREFLDGSVSKIAHIEQQHLTLYSGNYSDFEIMRAQKLAQQQAAHTQQQRQIEHMQQFVTRFKAKATKARQAQSRIKALERMEIIAPAHVDSPFKFAFQPAGIIPNPLLQLEKISIGYDQKQVLSDVNLSLLPGDRIGLLGPNGAGKSTLIKVLADKLIAQQGKRQSAKELRIGYFAQHQLEQLHDADSPLQHLQQLDDTASEKELRSYLGGFDFRDDMATDPVGPFSGGEKARLVLALLVYQKPNLLLLDEPTNHLDLEMRHALTLALQSFEGAMVLVSHDRALIRTVCDSLLLVANQSVTPFQGDLEDYAAWTSEQRRQSKQAETSVGQPSEASRKEQRRQAAEQRRLEQPLRQKIKKLEAELEKLNERKEVVTELLAAPDIYEEEKKDELIKLGQEHAEIEKKIEETEESWLEACAELEG